MIKSEEVLTLDEIREILKKKEERMGEKEGKQAKEREESKEREEKEEGGREEGGREGREGIMGSTFAYAKRFSKLKIEKVKELKEELKKLDIMKLKERHIAKIIDLLPEDTDDLRKIFVGEEVSLDQNEIEKILAVVKKYAK